MEKVNVYLDWSCGGCEEYLEEIESCCKDLNYEYILKTCDEDPLSIFKEIRNLRDEGHVIDYLPVMVTENNFNIKNVYVGILNKESIKNILKEI